MKTISCAIISFNSENKILMCHSTGNSFWDLPKGLKEENEEPEVAARREFLEETSLDIYNLKLQDLGLFDYNKQKSIHVFLLKEKIDFDLSKAKCTTYFLNKYTNKQQPEVDSFSYFSKDEALANSCKSMSNLLKKIL